MAVTFTAAVPNRANTIFLKEQQIYIYNCIYEVLPTFLLIISQKTVDNTLTHLKPAQTF